MNKNKSYFKIMFMKKFCLCRIVRIVGTYEWAHKNRSAGAMTPAGTGLGISGLGKAPVFLQFQAFAYKGSKILQWVL